VAVDDIHSAYSWAMSALARLVSGRMSDLRSIPESVESGLGST
jgi:hypothetical protein